MLFEALNGFHPKLKRILKSTLNNEGVVTTQVYRKFLKF